MRHVRIVYGDDWYGLYIDNELIDEGHELLIKTFVNMMKINHISADDIYNTRIEILGGVGLELLEDIGNFPFCYDDVEKYIIKE